MNGLRTSAAKNDGRLSKATDPPVPAVGVDRSLLNFMPDYLELPKHTTTLLYKARDGETKELRIVQPVETGTTRLTTKDIQLLGREIAKVLREDA